MVNRNRRGCSKRIQTGLKIAFLVSLVSLALCAKESEGDVAKATAHPRWSVELTKYGWAPVGTESDRSFFKDYSLAKLQALDGDTRVLFVANDLIIAYHTKQNMQDWRSGGQLEAFFINATDGKLLRTKTWNTSARGDGSDLRDSEGRLMPLSGGRFAIFVNQALLIYGSNLDLIRRKQLDPSSANDLWSAQSVAGGREIFLRHQSAATRQTSYTWLDSNTLATIARMSGFHGRDYSVEAIAGTDCVVTVLGFAGIGVTTGVGRITLDGATKIVCADRLCREGKAEAVIGRSIVVSGRTGYGIVDPERGLHWSKSIQPTENPNDFQFGPVHSAMSAERFAVLVKVFRKSSFDGIEISGAMNSLLFVYDTTSSESVLAIPTAFQGHRGITGFDFALSPDGRQLALFDGNRVELYYVHE